MATSRPFRLSTRLDLRRFDRVLAALQNRAADLSVPFRGPIDARITRFFEAQFETQGAAGGIPWAPLGWSTPRLRKRPGHGHEGPSAILRDTNVLWSSYVKSGGPDSIRVIEPKLYVRGSAVPYAGRHQVSRLITMMFGRPLRVPKVVPARPVVPPELPQALADGIETDVMQYLETGIA